MISGGFDYVALGHYHEFHEHKPNAYYAGATERFSFGEVESKPGFAVVEFDSNVLASVEHVEIEARTMLDLPKIKARDMGASELTEAVRERTEGVDLDGSIVRLRAYDVRHGVASGVDRALLRDLQRRCLNFSLEVHSEELPEELESGPVSVVFGPLEEELATFVGARRDRGELEAGFAEEFLEKGRGYLAQSAREEVSG